MTTTATPAELHEAARKVVEETRAAQGLTARVEDASALRKVARLTQGR